MIPFIDLKALHQELEEELLEVFRKALKTAAFVGGPQVEAFEREFAEFCETDYCVGVNSGTDALRFALIAAGIGPGDEVITVPFTFIATAEAISQTGAKPVFVDIDERTYNMDPQKLEDYLKIRNSKSKIRNRIKAVLPVHLYGQPADMDAILEIARRYDLIVIEDACQAHGAEYFSEKERRWEKTGSSGLAAAFSFYPSKNLGACGEAGAVTTNDEEIAQKVRILRDHGQAKKYFHEMKGYNGRLDAIQAGILRVKLRYLDEWNEKRRHNAYQYNDLLGELDGVIGPFEPSWTRAVYHLYVIRSKKKNELQNYLSDNGIATGLHYPIPLHLQKAYANLGYRGGDFPVSDKISSEILSLPMYPGLTYEQQKDIVERIKEFFATG
jgi:dTDP-4-amino-4,6-dideoxygalactose transaminase